MLQQPDVGTKRLLELADFIENMDHDRFSMSSWGRHEEPRCICGWYGQLHCKFDKMDWETVSRELGIDRAIGQKLFMTPWWGGRDAAKVLRHLAVTGELP